MLVSKNGTRVKSKKIVIIPHRAIQFKAKKKVGEKE